MCNQEKRSPAERCVSLSSLRAHLGTSGLTSMVHPSDGEREYERIWECGCRAVYRDTPHHTVRWRPCKLHATKLPITAPSIRSDDAVPSALSTIDRRGAAQFCLIDDKRDIIAASGEDVREIVRNVARIAPSLIEDAPSTIRVSEELFLRVTSIDAVGIHLKLALLERVRGLAGIEAVTRSFHLTHREADVLRLLTASKSNSEIARALFIAESTVGDHLKSIYRKMKSTRRTEVLAKVFDLSD